MVPPKTRLFHLHYHVPDIDHAERVLSDSGIPFHRRYGWVDDRFLTLREGEEIPEGFRLHLQDSQRGYANITLTPGKQVQFDHLGVYTRQFDGVITRAEEAGWHIHRPNQPRTFLVTPWGFRIELHAEGDEVEASLGSWEEAHFDEVVLTVPNPGAVQDGIDGVIGEIAGLVVQKSQDDKPEVPQATIIGSAFPASRTIQAGMLERASLR